MNENTSGPTESQSSEPVEFHHESRGRSRYRASELFGEATEIIIEMDSVEYRMRITSNGKLILTK